MNNLTKKLNATLLASGMLLTAMSGSANAANNDADITFTGAVPDTCSVVVTRGGVMTINANQNILDSTGASGVSGLAQVATNSAGSTIEVLSPAAFTLAPEDGDLNTTFSTIYSLDGGTIVENVQGTVLTPLGVGVTDMVVDATATKSAGTFNAGAYSMLVTVRCVTP
ncbi:MAG: hypothetical protein HKN36_06515 [Hellea sp.]|nr:hypothetical protein [Hellea sp.]